MAISDSSHPEPASVPAIAEQGENHRGGASRSLTVLVAEDQREMLELLSAWLQRAGHQVVGVSSGRQAAVVLKGLDCDVVVTDILMADGDGIELMSALRHRTPRPRIVAISGGGRYIDSRECLAIAQGCGAAVALKKPFSREVFLAAVQAVG